MQLTPASESRFTRPHFDCPDPQHWSSTDGDSTEREVTRLVAAFVVALQPGLVIETGAAWGQTAEAIGMALRDNGHGRLVTLEPDQNRAFYSRTRCAGLPVEVLEQDSLSYTPDAPIDFAWFDSLFELRPREFLRYLPHMSGRAVVGFHDTGPQHPVRGLLEALVADGMLSPPLYLPTPRGVCFARVGGPR